MCSILTLVKQGGAAWVGTTHRCVLGSFGMTLTMGGTSALVQEFYPHVLLARQVVLR
jgi:hypothetical protein